MPVFNSDNRVFWLFVWVGRCRVRFDGMYPVRRYWARSTFGWSSFSKATPNAAHVALAELEAAGKLGGVITQVGIIQ